MEERANHEANTIRPAIYARVSCEQQAQQNTIGSQCMALEERVRADGMILESELCFIDDGFSGSTLVRPVRAAARRRLGRRLHAALCPLARSPGTQIRLAGAAGRGVAEVWCRACLLEPHNSAAPRRICCCRCRA